MLIRNKHYHSINFSVFCTMDNNCDQCGKTYKNKNSLGHHVRNVHREAGAICSLCGSHFSQRQSLNRHMERVHNEEKFDCKECGKSFSTKGSLKKHMTCVHMERVHNKTNSVVTEEK